MYTPILNKYVNNELRNSFTGYDLSQIYLLLKLLGNPHTAFRSVHIAGTNGKGTTSSITGEILYRSGYTTGVYTSPHLINLNERISINKNEISDGKIYEYAQRIDRLIEKNSELSPTYFDILTAIAFLFFAESSIDIAVIETGLGGRLDSTNVLNPDVSVITEISLDHTSLLGKTIETIASEKAGIIKKNTPLVSSCTSTEALYVIESAANRAGVMHYAAMRDYDFSHIEEIATGYNFNYFMKPDRTMSRLFIPLKPEHQILNASCAVTTANILKEKGFTRISDDIIIESLKKTIIPGRFHLLKKNPVVFYDVAHNFDAMNKLFRYMEKTYAGSDIKIILSMMSDKVDHNVLNLLHEKKNSIIYFILPDERSYIPEQDDFLKVTDNVNELKQFLFTLKDREHVFLATGTFRLYKYILDIINDF